MLLNIIRYPNPVLSKKCKAIKKVDAGVQKLIEDMFETMYFANGIGLAAPQVAKLIRVIVVDAGNNPIALINPKVIRKKGKQTFMEGCLCLPGVEAPVERSAQIKVKGLDKNGKTIEIEAEGLLATVLQHEVDHLEGKVFIEKVKDPNTIHYINPDQERREERI